MGGGGGVIGGIIGAVVTVIGFVVPGAQMLIPMGLTMMASSVVSALTAPKMPDSNGGYSSQLSTGSNVQVPPATSNKLPVVYGTSYIGGTITDLSISSDNQNLYYVLALCEVTGNGSDNITIGDIYYGGKKAVLDGTSVKSLIDPSTGKEDKSCDGYIDIYLYKNGSYNPINTDKNAISVMQADGLTYKWDNSKLMSNTVFAIVHLKYNSNANITSIAQTQFEIKNPRNNAGDCFYDYLTNDVYGAAIPSNQIDTDSLAALTAYCNQTITFNNYLGVPSTQPRFKFNGVIDTTRNILTNLQSMSNCCDCLLKYNEIYGKWAVIVQSPSYSIATDINDSNMVSALQISSLDISNTYNVAQCQYPDIALRSSFNSTTIDLATVAPSLLYPNEPQNTQTIQLPLVNNNVQAQLLATRFLKSARMDLQVTCSINFTGLELEAGDIVTVTNANYGWSAKLFRVLKATQTFGSDGTIAIGLTLQGYDPTVFDDVAINQYKPPSNSGLSSPNIFGTIPTPTISNLQVNAADPSFQVNVSTSNAGIVQYAEIWYSIYQNPSSSQLIFAGTTEVQPNGNPYGNSVAIPPVTFSNFPSGDYYFFTRMVNSIATSLYSSSSALLKWRPNTFQYEYRYIVVAYADNITGAGFSFSPRNKTYYGLLNIPSANPSSNPSDYTWFFSTVGFGPSKNDNFLLYSNRNNRKFSFSVGNAVYIGIGGAFVPSETSTYDPTLWSALEDDNNVIDLDMRTGQVTQYGTSAISAADGLLSVTNNTQGTMVVSLQKFLNFGNGVYSKNFSPSSLTIDVYGRVVGFTQEDDFYYSDDIFTATAGQTSFAVTHIVGDVLVFRNGVLLNTTDYTETTSAVIMNVACVAGEVVEIINMRAVSTDTNYIPENITVGSLGNIQIWINNSSATVIWKNNSNTTIAWITSFTYSGLPYQPLEVGDQITFSDVGSPTVYTITSVDPVTKIVTFNTLPTGVSVGDQYYEYRPSGSTYQPFYRKTIDADNLNSYSPIDFYLRSGFEQIYVNGSQFNEVDYDLTDNVLGGFPAPITGKLDLILFSPNNLGVPCSNITNTVAYSAANISSYTFPNNPLAMQIYANGALFVKGSSYDYVPNTNGYNLNTTIPNNFTLLNQQTFARIGAA